MAGCVICVQPLIEKAEAAKATRAMEKIKKIKGLFGWLQDRLGRVASSLERYMIT